MGVLQILNDQGHTEVEWEVDDKKALANAEAAFNEAVAAGMGGFVMEDTKPVGVVGTGSDFPKEAERVIMSRPLVAG